MPRRRGLEDAAATIQHPGLDNAVAANEGKLQGTDVGDRNVAIKMREAQAEVGGENSGHIILTQYSQTGDGLLAALKLIEIIKELKNH